MSDLRRRTGWTFLQRAIFSPLSVLLIASGIVLVGLSVRVPVVNAPPVTWLVGLLPLWLLVVIVNVWSKQTREPVTAQVRREPLDVNHIANAHMRTVVMQALAYRERFDKAAVQHQAPASREWLAEIAEQVDEWVRRIFTLVKRLDAFHNDSVINRDLTSAPDTIKQLQVQLTTQTDVMAQHDIQDLIAQRQEQLTNLKNLDHLVDRAELQLETTLTALGTVYSQMLLLDTRDVDGIKTQRLRASIAEQLSSLTDIQSSLDEVYQPGSHQSQSAPV